MGAWVGSSGGIPNDGSVTEGKIASGAVSQEKLAQAVVDQLGGGSSKSSFLRFTGFNTKGSSNAFIMQIPAPTETKGQTDLFTVTNSAANGGYITVSQAVMVEIAWAVYNTSGASQNIQVMIGANLVNSCSQNEAELRKSGFVFNNTYPVAISTSLWLAPGEKLFFTAPFTPNGSWPTLNTLTIGANY